MHQFANDFSWLSSSILASNFPDRALWTNIRPLSTRRFSSQQTPSTSSTPWMQPAVSFSPSMQHGPWIDLAANSCSSAELSAWRCACWSYHLLAWRHRMWETASRDQLALLLRPCSFCSSFFISRHGARQPGFGPRKSSRWMYERRLLVCARKCRTWRSVFSINSSLLSMPIVDCEYSSPAFIDQG